MDVAFNDEPRGCANALAAVERPRQYILGAQGPLDVAVGDYVGHIGPLPHNLQGIQAGRRAREGSDFVRRCELPKEAV